MDPLQTVIQFSVINQILVHDFSRPFPDIVHPLYPGHLIFCFELFCHAFSRGHFFYQPEKRIFRLSVDIGKVVVQFPGREQIEIQLFFVLPDIA